MKSKFLLALAVVFLSTDAFAQKLTAGNVDITANGTANLIVSVEAETVQCATNFTITLPDGITADLSDKTKLTGSLLDDHTVDASANGNEVVVLIYSSNISNFKEKTGSIFVLPLKAADLSAGTLKGKISNITVSDADENEIDPDDVEFDIVVSVATGINGLPLNDPNAEVYTVGGKRVKNTNLKKGVYVVNGKKVVVK